MSNRLVLVDSSAWINYLAGQRVTASESIATLLSIHRIAINDVIRVEVLSGAANEAQYGELSDQLEGLHKLPLTDAVWRRAERVRFELRQKGHLAPVPDLLIACCAVLHDCELLHADRHFEMIARAMPLTLHHGAK